MLDTETTGLEHERGHRIIEIGCVELINRRLTGQTYHQYINPQREVERGALEIHGLSDEFLADKPGFEQIYEAFLAFVDGAELIIHNASFDVGFLNSELEKLPGRVAPIDRQCRITDNMKIARHKHPGQRVSLDALCQRYAIDNSQRKLHGALLDAEILAEVYLAMTGGQTALQLGDSQDSTDVAGGGDVTIRRLDPARAPLPVLRANAAELQAHEQLLETLAGASADGTVVWRQANTVANPAE